VTLTTALKTRSRKLRRTTGDRFPQFCAVRLTTRH